jgi:Carboxypeptidase regulatory-like domain
MHGIHLFSISIACVAVSIPLWAQRGGGTGDSKPSVFLENNNSRSKDSKTRTVTGVVKDQNDNPIPGAIVQLKDMKTSKVIDFPTKGDGTFTFRDLALDSNYELVAKHDQLTSPAKKVTIYDTRKSIMLTFKLEPPSKDPPQ